MRIIVKGCKMFGDCIASVIAKIRWGKDLTLEGLLHKTATLQLIISENGKLTIKRNVSFQRNVSLTAIGGGELTIGQNVSFNRNCIVICHKKITICDNVKFGPNVTIYDHDHIFSYDGIQSGYKYGEIKIGKGSWIAANVTILRNTSIGEGCVIGAGCIIKGNIPPHSLVTGSRDLSIVPIQQR